jgi:hypothetical protein
MAIYYYYLLTLKLLKMKRLSILGGVLLVASAVTAAFIPSSAKTTLADVRGDREVEGDGFTCTASGVSEQNCQDSDVVGDIGENGRTTATNEGTGAHVTTAND